MISIIAAGLTCMAATYIFLLVLQQFSQSPQEPPIAASTIPFLSPLIGMAKQSSFYTELRDRDNLPIYTLRLPGSRLYIINSLKLIAAAQRQVRTLDFAPIATRAAVNVMGASPEGTKILHTNHDGTSDYVYAIAFNKAIHPTLSPGANLDATNRSSLETIAASLDALAAKAPVAVNLYEWSRKEMTKATTEAVYGPGNPFRDPKVEEAFSRLEPGIVILLLRFFPTILARDSIKAREVMVKAFLTYFHKNGHEQGSSLVRARYQHSIDYKFSIDDIARFEVGGAFAILSNTIPTAFWLLWHIVSDPQALEDCRSELIRACQTSEKSDTVSLDITEVKSSCPMLVSAFQEVLRFHGTGISVRVVQEDHLLNGEYLLKKGNTVLIPGPVQHTSKETYGDDVETFKYKRFMRNEGKRLNPAGFRGFGGGSTLCPGRHFVSTEIIAFVSFMILRFDITPVSGKWSQPTTKHAGAQATIPAPDTDVRVNITPREGGFANKKWLPVLQTSNKAFELVIEDVTTY